MTLPTTQLELVAQERPNGDISPTPWRVERVKMKDGYRRLSILDANGHAVANLVMRPDADNEMHNARAIVAAINEARGRQ
jgi:hypothetical protein